MCPGKSCKFLSLFRREVRHDEAVETDLRRFSDDPFEAVVQEGVVIAHENEWCGHILRPQIAYEIECHAKRRALFECDLRGVLYGCPVGQRIGERDAKLHHV